jgi:WD40 repeat protein
LRSVRRPWPATKCENSGLRARQRRNGASLGRDPRGRWLATASNGDKVFVWSADGRTLRHTLAAPGSVAGVATSPDGARLVTAIPGGAIQVWDPLAGARVREYAHDASVTAGAFHPSGRWLATAHGDGTLIVEDPADRGPACAIALDGALWACGWFPGRPRVLAGGAAGAFAFDWHPSGPATRAT